MTPERWQLVGDLFEEAVRIAPGAREAWLRETCGADEGLRLEVGRLLAGDERVDRDGFLTPPGPADPPHAPTASWSASTAARRPGIRPPDPVGAAPNCDGEGFTPREAIARPAGPHAISEPSDVVRAAPRAADGLHPHPGRPGPLAARRHRGRRPDALSRRCGDRPGPRRPHRRALEPPADLAGLAQGPGAGHRRHARRPGRDRAVPHDARFLARRRRDDGATRPQERGAAERRPDPHLRALRPQELATCRARSRSARRPALRDVGRPGRAVSGRHEVAVARVEPRHDPEGRPVRLRCAHADDPGGRLGVRGAHDLSPAAAGRRGPEAGPVLPGTTPRRGRDGRGLPGRAQAAEAPLRREADPPGPRVRAARAGAIRARGPPDRQALASQYRRRLRLRPGRGRHLLLRHGIPSRPEPRRAGRAPRPAAARRGRSICCDRSAVRSARRTPRD